MVELEKLQWDEGNVNHIARHDVTKKEVEEVFMGFFQTFEGKKGRLGIIGRTRDGRFLTVILDPIGGGQYYPVTAHPSSRKQRRSYIQRSESND